MSVKKVFLSVFIVVALVALVKTVHFLWQLENPEIQSEELPIDVKLNRSVEETISIGEIVSSSDNTKLLVFWATWCLPCKKELPWLAKKQSFFDENKIEVVLINYDSGNFGKVVAGSHAWLISRGVDFTNYFDPNEMLLKNLKVAALPFSLLSNSDGKILWSMLGGLEEGDLDKIIEASHSIMN